MNAQTVWHVWRRIMRETSLQQALFNGDGVDLGTFGFSDAERKAALAYAAEADRAKWFVLNYRFRLTNSFLNALETGAPLVLRALLNKGLNMQQVGARYLDMHGWKDYGPFVYAYCHDALAFLMQDDVTATPAGLRSLIGLEMAVVDLLRGLAMSPDSTDVDTPLIRRSPYARSYRSDYRLSVWLRDKKALGGGDLPAGTEDYLVYLTDLESTHKFALLPPRAAEILQALSVPCYRKDLGGRLSACGYAPHDDRDAEYLSLLKAHRAISGQVD